MILTPEHAAWRAEGIGGSDVAKIVTGSYGGLYSVVADKMGHPTDINPDLADRGHRWEQPIADAVHALTGYYVHGEQMLVEAHDDQRMRCTLDGLLDRRPEIAGIDEAEALLEIKTHGLNVKPNWAYHRAQPQFQMHVTGKQRALLAVARIDDTDDTLAGLHLEWIDRDDFVIGQMVDAAEHALLCVEAGELPDPDCHADLLLVREINGLTSIEAGSPDIEDIDDDLARWLELKAAAKAVVAEADGIEAKIRHRMGQATIARSDRHLLKVGEPVWKFTRAAEADALGAHPEHAKTVLDRPGFKAAHPDLYEELKRPTTDRRITVKDITK